VTGQDADKRDPSRAHHGAGNREPERARSCRPDHLIAGKRREPAVELEHDPLMLVGLRMPIGVVERLDGNRAESVELPGRDRPQGNPLDHAYTYPIGCPPR